MVIVEIRRARVGLQARFVPKRINHRAHTLATLVAVAGMAAPGSSALAQEPLFTTPLDSGRLIRLEVDDGRLIAGRLLQPLSNESRYVTFCRYPAPPCRDWTAPHIDSLPVPQLTGLEVAQGTRLWRGVTIGAAIGGALGLLYAVAYNGLCDWYRCGVPLPVGIIAGATFVGAWGALFGSQATVWGPAP